MNADSGLPLKTLRVDGGLSNSDICMQLQSNILGLEVARPQMRESTALGAATAAGVHLGVGIWKGGFKAFAERARESKEVLQFFNPKINDEGNELTSWSLFLFSVVLLKKSEKGRERLIQRRNESEEREDITKNMQYDDDGYCSDI